MTPPVLAFAVCAGLVLAGAAVSFAALWRASILLRRTAGPAPSGVSDAAIDVLQQKLETLQQEVQELRQHPSGAPTAAAPRHGLNLSRRSQALRMHRRGESPSQIAAALDMPLQEVDLLLKVHRIVLRNL